MAIKKLPQYLINILKAGEIVERPASIVKELLENSLDAGANTIKLIIKDGGKETIQIIDDGCGIQSQDIPLTIERYATSKISDEKDLYNINSYGFRGEALASISEVSKFTLQTKTVDSAAGYQLDKISDHVNISSIAFDKSHGTNITIQDLFFNTPVRRKFLKSSQTEWSYIYSVFVDFALLHFDKRLILIKDGKQIFDLQKNSDLYARVFEIYSKSFEKNIKIVEKKDNLMQIFGLVSDSNLTFLTQDNIKIFVNKRPVQDKVIKRAVMEVYQRQLPPKEFPFAVLYLDIAPNLLDVNVHPRKIEVKFLDTGNIYNFVKQAISDLFAQDKIVSGGTLNLTSFQSNPYNKLNSSMNQNTASSLDLDIINTFVNKSSDEQSFNVINDSHTFNIVGQIWDSYILLQDENQLYIVDQHALAERIAFENFRNDFEQNGVLTSILLSPINIQLGKDKDFTENISDLNMHGFDISMLSESSAVVYAVPQAFETHKIKIEVLLNKLLYLKNIDLKIILDEIWATNACKISIKSGEKLNFMQMQQLIKDGFEYISGMFVCQHGRPSFVKIDKDSILKLFDRK